MEAERMKRRQAIVGVLVLLGAVPPTVGTQQLDRRALVALMEQYLAALASHDPSRVPLASDVKREALRTSGYSPPIPWPGRSDSWESSRRATSRPFWAPA